MLDDADISSMIFIGVDQTGAVQKNGTPKPLPIAVVHTNKKICLSVGYISSFSNTEIHKFLASQNQREFNKEDIQILMDCVLGLPQDVYTNQKSFRDFLLLALKHQGYGRSPAQTFFKKLRGNKPILNRTAETLAKANSVFVEHPFQKNIQTGTFRLWKELGTDLQNFYIPYMEPKKSNAYRIYEGYPSLSWKVLFGTSYREPKKFLLHVKKFFHNLHIDIHSKRLIKKDPNLADAATLALHIYRDNNNFEYPKSKIIKKEGWIFSLQAVHQ